MHVVDGNAVHLRFRIGEQREERQRMLARRRGKGSVGKAATQRGVRRARMLARRCAGDADRAVEAR